jgi:hypothetical protein
MEKFDTYFGLCLALKVFGDAEELSRALQAEHIMAQEAFIAVECTRKVFNKYRNEEAFKKAFESAKVAAAADPEGRIGEPNLARRRKVPKKLHGGAEHFFDDSPEEFYRHQFFEILDILNTQLVERFHQPAFAAIQSMERIFEEAAKGRPVTSMESLKELYSSDLDFRRLQVQFQMLPSLSEKECNNMNEIITAVKMAIKTGGTVMERMLSEVITLLRIYLTLPVTTATSERSFSVLRRTKNYMRSTMTQPRLNSAMLCSIHKERLDALDIDVLATEFCKVNDRRRAYFGL